MITLLFLLIAAGVILLRSVTGTVGDWILLAIGIVLIIAAAFTSPRGWRVMRRSRAQRDT